MISPTCIKLSYGFWLGSLLDLKIQDGTGWTWTQFIKKTKVILTGEKSIFDMYLLIVMLVLVWVTILVNAHASTTRSQF